MNDTTISISRSGQELGTWNLEDIRKMLAAGVLASSDHFWREGMPGWSTLADLVPSPPSTVDVFPVEFGSSVALDPLGFVGKGELRLEGDRVEIIGRRQWPGLARFGMFAVAAPLGWSLSGVLISALPRDGGAALHWFAACLWLFTLVGIPMLVLTLMPFFCASATREKLDRSKVGEVSRNGRAVMLMVKPGGGKFRPCRCRAKTDSEAERIVNSFRR